MSVIVESSHALPLVTVNVALPTGSLADPVGQEGLTGALARLCRRTGGGRTSQQMDDAIESLGATLGIELGGHSLRLGGHVIARSLDAYVDLLTDVLGAASLAADERDRLLRATEGELRSALDSDRTLARRWFRRGLFAGHPYARPSYGTIASLGRIDGGSLSNHRDRVLQRDGLVLSLAGDVTSEQASSMFERIASALGDGPRTAVEVPEPALGPGRHLLFVDKPDRTQTQILLGGLGTHPHDDDHMALHVANTVLGGAFTSRLMKAVRSERGWSYGAYSSLSIGPRRQAFSMWTFPKGDDAGPCIALKVALLEGWVNDGITADELSWAQRYLVKSNAFSIDTPSKRASLALEERLNDLPEGYYANYPRAVEAVTVDDVNAAIRRRIDPERLLFCVVGTADEVLEPVKAAIPDLASTRVIPYDHEA